MIGTRRPDADFAGRSYCHQTIYTRVCRGGIKTQNQGIAVVPTDDGLVGSFAYADAEKFSSAFFRQTLRIGTVNIQQLRRRLVADADVAVHEDAGVFCAGT